VMGFMLPPFDPPLGGVLPGLLAPAFPSIYARL
jgi:hypothetical protein